MSRTRAQGPHGLLLVDKPAGPSSAEMVDWVRWSLHGQPVGHFGTLDPAATGLLVLGVGWGTRLTAILTDEDKTYRAVIALGQRTDTDDAAGSVVEEADVSISMCQAAEATLRAMVGDLHLSPPAYSAVKVGGQRAYARTRRGETIELEPRRMVLHDVQDVVTNLECRTVEATFAVRKGTYIRSLAVELGHRLGCPAHLRKLRRMRCGAASINDPRVLQGFSVDALPPRPDGKPRHRVRWQGADADRGPQGEAILERLAPLTSTLPFPIRTVRHDDLGRRLLRAASQGQAISSADPGWLEGAPDATLLGIASSDGSALLLARCEENQVRPYRTVLPWREDRTPSSIAEDGRRGPELAIAIRHLDNTPTG